MLSTLSEQSCDHQTTFTGIIGTNAKIAYLIVEQIFIKHREAQQIFHYY